MKAKRKPAAKAKRSPDKATASDARLISECVVYAQEIGAYDAGFKADPDGSSKNAANLGDQHLVRARQALAKIATMKASTPTGLQAKARVLPLVIEDCGGSLQESDEAFCRSIAADMQAFLDPLVHADWVATKDAA
jgi:hypothetical protein